LKKAVSSTFYCKIITDVPKITKRDAFSLFQSETFIFHDEEIPFTSFPGAKKGKKDAAVLSKVHHGAIQKQKGEATNTHTHTHRHPKIRSVQHIQNSNFRFKSRETAHKIVSGAKKITPRL
jgi:hypothetical protein